jgi:hypothetical protein
MVAAQPYANPPDPQQPVQRHEPNVIWTAGAGLMMR